jgi:uncharacterized protein (PEP-CTERM system associated)
MRQRPRRRFRRGHAHSLFAVTVVVTAHAAATRAAELGPDLSPAVTAAVPAAATTSAGAGAPAAGPTPAGTGAPDGTQTGTQGGTPGSETSSDNGFPVPPISALSGRAPTGTTVWLPDLSNSVTETLGLGEPPQPGWVLTPEIGVQEIYTDNVLQTPSNHRYDIITEITPGLRVNADTPRVQLNLRYAPVVQLFARTPGQNNLSHQLNGYAQVVVVPELFYVDMRGYATQQPSFGGFATNGPRNINSNDQSQETSFTVAPYLLHRFGSYGVGEAGYSFSTTGQSGNTQLTPGDPTALSLPSNGALTSFRSGVLTTQEEHVAFTSGEILARLRSRTLLDAIQYNGDMQDGHRNLAIETVKYALTRLIGVLGSGGYEDIAFNGSPSVRINDAVWEVGVSLAAGPDRTLTVTYGHRDGFTSPTFDLNYALTARTRVFARYSENLTTTAQDLQSYVATSGVDTLGNSIDPATQTPVVATNSFFAVNDNLVRSKTFSATLFHQRERDTGLLSVYYQNQTLVSTGQVAGYAQRGLTESLTWIHELTPVWSSRANVQYGDLTTTGAFAGRTGVFSVDMALIHNLSETTTLTLEWQLTNRSDTLASNRLLQNIVLVGLRKTFQ